MKPGPWSQGHHSRKATCSFLGIFQSRDPLNLVPIHFSPPRPEHRSLCTALVNSDTSASPTPPSVHLGADSVTEHGSIWNLLGYDLEIKQKESKHKNWSEEKVRSSVLHVQLNAVEASLPSLLTAPPGMTLLHAHWDFPGQTLMFSQC